jgi:hypothetical protein
MVVVVVDGCEGVVGVMWGERGWCGWRWSGDGVGVLALEIMGEAFVGAEDRGGCVDLALIDEGAGPSSPQLFREGSGDLWFPNRKVDGLWGGFGFSFGSRGSFLDCLPNPRDCSGVGDRRSCR